MARPTTWFTPLDRPPFATEHHDRAGAPANLRVLEISSRSDEPLGRSLSAMRLRAADTDDEHGLPVESVYQAAKCYGDRGPDRQPLPKRIRRQATRPRAPRQRAADRLRARRHVLARRLRKRLLRPPLDQGRRGRSGRPSHAQPARLRRVQRPVPPSGTVGRLPGPRRRHARGTRPRRAARRSLRRQQVDRHARPAAARPSRAGGHNASTRERVENDPDARAEPRRDRAGRRSPHPGVRQPQLLGPRPGRRQARRGPPTPRRRPHAGDL